MLFYLLLIEVGDVGGVRRRIFKNFKSKSFVFGTQFNGLGVNNCLVHKVRVVIALVVEKCFLLRQKIGRKKIFEFQLSILGCLVLLLPLQLLIVNFILVWFGLPKGLWLLYLHA